MPHTNLPVPDTAACSTAVPHQPAIPETRKRFSSELALALGISLIALCVALGTKSNLGLTGLSLPAYTLSLLIPQVSMGIWTYLIQCAIMALLIILVHRVKMGYLLAFALSLPFGLEIDLFNFLLQPVPYTPLARGLCYILSFFLCALGLAFSIHCRLPILPMDIFTREVPEHFGLSFRLVRTASDILFLGLSAALGWFLLGGFPGIGVGTLITSLFLGTAAGKFISLLGRHFVFVPRFAPFAKLMDK